MLQELQTFFIRTYGCQMNELDSEIMRGILEKRGLQLASSEDDADLLLFNTCSIRDLAERKVLGKIGRRTRRSQRARRQIIGIAGCMANAKKESLFEKVDGVDFIIGTNNIHDLDAALDDVLEKEEKVIKTDDRFHEELDYLIAKRKDPIKAHVSIIRGCNKFCTYCVVPYTRGPEVSRAPDSIFEECRQLVDNGYKEITLLGQNVDSYGKDAPQNNCNFAQLLYRLDKIPGLERVRFLTSHPVDITKELMEAIRDLTSVCEYVHFPLQAGSNRILKKMHRMYTKEEYIEKAALLRSIVPGVAIGTDIIVGFPTETDEEFEETLETFRAMRFTSAFLFAYSARKGTPAARWKDAIPQEVKDQRLQAILDLHDLISREELAKFIRTEVEILVEEVHPRISGCVRGRTRTWHNAAFPGGKELLGTIQKMKVEKLSHQTLHGTMSRTASKTESNFIAFR